MIRDDEHLHQAQQDIQTLWHFLETARKTHASLDYQRLAAPYLLQLQERQQDVVEYLIRQASPLDADLA
jgi:hypothetical protein